MHMGPILDTFFLCYSLVLVRSGDILLSLDPCINIAVH